MLDFIFSVGVALSILALLLGAYLSILGTTYTTENAGEDETPNPLPLTAPKTYKQRTSSVRLDRITHIASERAGLREQAGRLTIR